MNEKLTSMFRYMLLTGFALGICACSDNYSQQQPSRQNTGGASYFENSDTDNNGVEPQPNNGSQDFGRER